MDKENIFLPQKVNYIEENPRKGQFIIEPCWPGYGTTWGNALRRVLMSSLKGGAVDRVLIKGVRYEFSTLKGVKEDVLQILLNLKKLRFQIFQDEEVELSLQVKGKKVVTGADIEKNPQAVVANPEQKIATLTSKDSSLSMKLWVKSGYGWVPSEEKPRQGLEIGTLVMDSQFSPIKSVIYHIENMIVGKRTDFERLILTIETDGSLTPKQAFEKACSLLEEHFHFLRSQVSLEGKKEEKKEKEEKKKTKKEKSKGKAKKSTKKSTKKKK